MGLFGGGEARIRKEIGAVLDVTMKMLVVMFEKENLVEDLRLERPDSQFRFCTLCLSAVVVSCIHKLGNANVVAVNACHNLTDWCLEDPTRFFGGRIDAEVADQQGIDLQRNFLERLISIAEEIGSTKSSAGGVGPMCELVHEIESPEPITPADYKRLSEFAGGMFAFMLVTRENF